MERGEMDILIAFILLVIGETTLLYQLIGDYESWV